MLPDVIWKTGSVWLVWCQTCQMCQMDRVLLMWCDLGSWRYTYYMVQTNSNLLLVVESTEHLTTQLSQGTTFWPSKFIIVLKMQVSLAFIIISNNITDSAIRWGVIRCKSSCIVLLANFSVEITTSSHHNPWTWLSQTCRTYGPHNNDRIDAFLCQDWCVDHFSSNNIPQNLKIRTLALQITKVLLSNFVELDVWVSCSWNLHHFLWFVEHHHRDPEPIFRLSSVIFACSAAMVWILNTPPLVWSGSPPGLRYLTPECWKYRMSD